jgi:hypothetical protein
MPKYLIAFALAAVLVVTACGDQTADDGGASALPPADQTCLAGSPECEDLGPADEPILPGEPTDDAPGLETPPGGGLSVADVVANDIDGGFAIQGFYVDSGDGPFLCDALLESFPPQCGGASIPFQTADGLDLDLTTEGDVTWSADQVVVVGEVVDGVFVATPIAE